MLSEGAFRTRLSRYSAEIAVFFGAFTLLAPGLFWGMPSEFPSEIDTIVPMGPIRFFMNFAAAHDQLAYPALHYLVLGVVYAVCFAIFKVTGMLGMPVSAYPFGLHDPVAAMTTLIVASRTVSAVMAAGICALLFRTIRKMTDRFTALLITLSLMSSAVFVYYARVANLDIPECFWWALSYTLFLRGVYRVAVPERRSLLLSGICGGLAVATKDQAVMFIIPQCLLLLYDGGTTPVASRRRKFLAYGSIIMGSYGVAAILPQPARWANHISFILTHQGGFRSFGYSVHGQAGLLAATLRCMVTTASPLIALTGAAGTVLLIVRRKWAQAVSFIAPVLFFYGALIVPVGFVYERFTLNAAMIAMVPAAMVIFKIRQHSSGKAHFPLFAAAACMLIALEFYAGYLPLTIAMAGGAKTRLTAVLARTVPAGSRILLHASYFSLPNGSSFRRYAFCSNDRWVSNGSKRLELLIDRDTAQAHYVLADHDILHRNSWKKGEQFDTASFSLLEKVTFPEWIERGARVYRDSHAAGVFFVAQRYFLYGRR
jgi:hypothetical protein